MDDEFLSKYAGFDSVEEDRKLRLFAVNSYIPLLRGEPGKLPQRFLQVISWVSDALTMWIINRLILLCNKSEKQKNSTCSYCSVYVIQLNIKVLEIQNSFTKRIPKKLGH